jgi:nicotinate phosphoribosyltransferase
MAEARAPIDVVGTGSFIPNTWSETYATADIVAYDGVPRVKLGREFLLKAFSSQVDTLGGLENAVKKRG